MKRALLLVLAVGLAAVGEETLPEGKYRKKASARTIKAWKSDLKAKRDLVPLPMDPAPSAVPATDFRGSFRYGPYNYDVVIEQVGDQVSFRSGGVDHQDIGGAFQTVGAGYVSGGRIHARWWCFDITRNYGNTGGCEMWFKDGDKNLLYTRYYHDADEAIEDGYGVRVGTHEGRRLHYRIRVARKTKKFEGGRELKGTVHGFDGEPLRDAVVMLRHNEKSAVRTDEHGRWSMRLESAPYVLMVSAAAPGYRNHVLAILLHEWRDLHFRLEASPFSDDPRYEFVDPTPNRKRGIWRCGNCHKNSYAEWNASRHALAARNTVTRVVYQKDFLPGVRDGSATGDEGLCAACHAPSASLDGRVARLDKVEGVALLGNHCDFCHKIHHTEDLSAPGVRGSLELGRPSPDDSRVPGPIKRVYGSLADVDYVFMGPVYNPYFSTGALCAGCHQYRTGTGIRALDTYDEWRRWAQGRRRHESCQTCHMPTGISMEGKKLAKRICVNALRRPMEQIHDHSFGGREMAPTAVEVTARSARTAEGVEVTVDVLASAVGHRVPTGSGDKHLLLTVVARDAKGRPLALATGSRVPDHAGGEGDPLRLDAAAFAQRMKAHDFAGVAGREFAQVLVDKEGRTHVPFWRAAREVEDTRLEPGRAVRAQFTFAGEGPISIKVELWHRLRFKRHDVARGVEGPGVRPLDMLVGTATADLR